MPYSKSFLLIVTLSLGCLAVGSPAVQAQNTSQLNPSKAYSSPSQANINPRKSNAANLEGTREVNLRTSQPSQVTTTPQQNRVAERSRSALDFVQLTPALGPTDIPAINEDRGLKIQIKGRED